MVKDESTPVVFLNRTSILNALDTEYRDVFVPEWNGTVRVRSISANERERLMKSSMIVQGKGKHAVTKFDMPTFRVKISALAMVDVEGNRLFGEDDVVALGRKNARAMERVSDVALELSGVQDDSEETVVGPDGQPVEDDDAGKDGSPTPSTG